MIERTTKTESSIGSRYAGHRRQREDLENIYFSDNQEHRLRKGQTFVRHFADIDRESEGSDIWNIYD